MLFRSVNEDNEYEIGDDANPNEEDDVCDDDGPIDAYATHYPTAPLNL